MTKEERKEYDHQRYLKNKVKITEQTKQYYLENKERRAEYNKQYYLENKERRAEYWKQYRQEHAEYWKQWGEKNPDYQKQYYQTPIGRAIHLAGGYKQSDKLYNRGECTITAQWMVDNIFNGQRCLYCKESDWTKLGCDRIYNDLPHTPDNVVVCCEECNKKRGTKPFEEFCKEMGVKPNKHFSCIF